MLKVLICLAVLATGICATEEIQRLEQQLAEMHKKTSVAGKFAQLAGHVMKNRDQAEEMDAILEQQFSALGDQGIGPVISKLNIKNHEEAVAARSYYLGARDNIFAAGVVLALEIMALQASKMDQNQRNTMNMHLAQTFDGMKEVLAESNLAMPAIEKKDISTAEGAIAARAYYKSVKENLIGRVDAMAKGESFC